MRTVRTKEDTWVRKWEIVGGEGEIEKGEGEIEKGEGKIEKGPSGGEALELLDFRDSPRTGLQCFELRFSAFYFTICFVMQLVFMCIPT